MTKPLMLTVALIVGSSSIASAQTTLQTGRSAYTHHHRMHAMHMRHHRMSYGVGGDGRTTATGGNAGGYSSKN